MTKSKSGNIQLGMNAHIHEDLTVHGDFTSGMNAEIHGNLLVHGNARVGAYNQVHGGFTVYGNLVLDMDAKIHKGLTVHKDAVFGMNNQVHGDVVVHGYCLLWEPNVKFHGNVVEHRGAKVPFSTMATSQILESALASFKGLTQEGGKNGIED